VVSGVGSTEPPKSGGAGSAGAGAGNGVLRNKRTIVAETAERAPVVGGLPYFFTVHLLKPCNQQCIMCLPAGKFPAEILPFDRFLALFEQIKPVAEHITLIGGEPLMYPKIVDVLDLLAQHEIAVTMNTNATLLSPKLTPHLIELHELNLKCSIDAATRETYHRVRGKDTFDRVTTNVRDFSAARDGRDNIRVILIFVVMRENLGDVLPYLDYAASLNVHRVEFHPVRQVQSWKVQNGTGWTFDGREQSCEFFADEYNDLMLQAEEKGKALGVRCETLLL
jgi:MoaA/NifB/PqqE/SkfB family radical SAM enzyme